MKSDFPPPLNDLELSKIRKMSMEIHGLGIYQYRFDGIITYIDKIALQIFNLQDIYPNPEMAIGKKISDLIIYTEKEGSIREKVKKKHHFIGESYHFKTLDGQDRWVLNDFYLIKHPTTGEELVHATMKDITDRQITENLIKKSLNEKEMLLKEVHHRVKNNLQIICSLVNLEWLRSGKKDLKDPLQSMVTRIRSMGIIHEQLYGSNDFESIAFNEFIETMINELSISFIEKTKTIKFNLQLESISLDINRAIPCGLLINEIVTNAIKHAFKEVEEGEIQISLTKENNRIKLMLSDNGKSSSEDFSRKNNTSLGMELIYSLSDQLKANLDIDTKDGFKYVLSFNE